MNKKRARWRGYTLFALVLAVADLAIFFAPCPRPIEPAAVVIQEEPELTQYCSRITRKMHFLTKSGCFQRTEACLQRVDMMVNHTEPGLTVEEYRQYLLDGIADLWEAECVRHIVGCGTSAYDVLNRERKEWNE